MPLSVTTHSSGDIPVLVCQGRIVEGTEADSLRDQIEKELGKQPFLLLDFREMDFIDSSGLGLLVRLAMKAKKDGGDLKLCCVSPRIEATLKTTKVNTILKSYPSESDALASFSNRPQSKKPIRKADVMCVTSSPDLLAYLANLLQQSGFAVSTSGSLHEAEMMLKLTRPKFLVIDSYFSSTITADVTLRERFNDLIDGVAIVELPPGFATSDAGDAGRQLVKHLRQAWNAQQSP